MSINLTQQPPDLAWARNPCLVVLRSLNSSGQTFAAKGVKSAMLANSLAMFGNGATLTVDYGDPDGQDEIIVFTAVAMPTAENEIPDDAFSGSGYWAAVAAAVQAHHLIAPFFTVKASGSLAGTTLTIQERTATAGWAVEFSNSQGFSVTNTATVTPDSTPANYRARLEVFFEKTWMAGDWSRAASLEGKPDASGFTRFDISSVVDGQCRASQSPFDFPTIFPKRCDNLRRFFIRYSEEFGEPITNEGWTETDVLRVVNGGISMRRFANGETISSVAAETGGWLTWMPDGREVGPNAQNFLTFFNAETSAKKIALKVKWWNRDTLAQSASTIYFGTNALEISGGESATVPISPAIFGLDTQILAYKMAVRVVDSDSGDVLSEWRNFLIDRTHYRAEQMLGLRNAFGAEEAIRCRGVWEKKAEVERKFAQKVLPSGFGSDASEEAQVSEKVETTYIFRTGFIARTEADVLFGLLAERDVCLIKPDGLEALYVISKNFSITDSDRQLHAYQFEARPKLQSKNFSGTAPTLEEEGSGIGWMEIESTNIVG
jgi:hypothetical protein